MLGIDPAPDQAGGRRGRRRARRSREFFGVDLARQLRGRGQAGRRDHRQQRHGARARPQRLRRGHAATCSPDDGVVTVENPYVARPDRPLRVRHDLPRAPLLLLVHRGRRARCGATACSSTTSSTSRPARRHAALAHRQARRRRATSVAGYLAPRRTSWASTDFELLRGLRRAGRGHPRRPARPAARACKAEGKTIAAYGAAAKGSHAASTTSGIGTDLVDFVVDRNVHKQGLLMPGVHIPIRRPRGAASSEQARLRAAARLELQGRDHRPAGRVPPRAAGSSSSPFPSPRWWRDHDRTDAHDHRLPGLRQRRPAVVPRRRTACRATAACCSTPRRRRSASRRGRCGSRFCRGVRLHHQHALRRVAQRLLDALRGDPGVLAPVQRVRRRAGRSAGSTRYDLHGKTSSRSAAARASSSTLMCELGDEHGHRHRPRRPPERLDDAGGDRITLDPGPLLRAATRPRRPTRSSAGTRSSTSTPSREFMTTVRAAIGDRPDTVVLFELPDVQRVLDEACASGTSTTSTARTSAPARWPGCSGAPASRCSTLRRDYDDQYLTDRGPALDRAGARRAAADRGRHGPADRRGRPLRHRAAAAARRLARRSCATSAPAAARR